MRVALHTDHCPPEQVDEFIRPLLAASRERVERGEPPLFNSHMFDGSTLPLEENLAMIRASSGVPRPRHHPRGRVPASSEVRSRRHRRRRRRLPAVHDDRGPVSRGRGPRHRRLPARRHVRRRPRVPRRRPRDVAAGDLREGQDALAAAHPGARFAYVFHGSSGTGDAELAEAVSYGVVKVNVDTEMQYAFTRAIADHVLTRYNGVLRVDGSVGDETRTTRAPGARGPKRRWRSGWPTSVAGSAPQAAVARPAAAPRERRLIRRAAGRRGGRSAR